MKSERRLETTDQMVRVADRLVALADTLVDDFDVVELLDQLVADCVDLLAVSAAGILLRNRDDVLDVVASSNEASRLMEVFQLQSDKGPSIDAVTTGEQILVEHLDVLRRRWPDFAHAVEGAGFAEVYAIPLRLRSETIGALNLFNTSESTLTGSDLRLAQALADVATIGIIQQRSTARASLLAEQLQLALTTRITVEQAKGILAEYGGIDVGAAFVALRGYARTNRAKLSGVAGQLVSRTLDPSAILPPGVRRPLG